MIKISAKKLKELEKDPLIQKIKKSLLEEKAKSAKFGLDIGKHWQDMQNSLKDNKKKNEMNKEKEFYKAEDLAKLLEVNIMTIYRYIDKKKLKAYKIGRDFRIDKTEFQRFLKSVRTK